MTDPRWIEPIYSNVDGQDFLGLRLVQERIVGHLLPGIITITPRARYYAFYSWLLVEYARQHPAGWSFNRFIRRHEQIFGLANVAYGGTVAGLAGFQTFSAHWQAYAGQSDIPLMAENYLQAARRGYGLYAGVMRTLGLVDEHEDGQGLEVTTKGQALAAAFAQAIADTAYYWQRHRYDEAASIETAVLREYGACCSLDTLAGQTDHMPALELLIALDAPLEPDPHSPDATRVGNMRGTLGLLLDMQQQSQEPLSESLFRLHSLYGLCADYANYRPAAELEPVLAQWQMFQIRDLYTYGLYALWTYFLHYLKGVEEAPLPAFYAHLVERVDLTAAARNHSLPLAHASSSQPLSQHLSELLDAAGIPSGDWSERCQAFAWQSRSPLDAQALYKGLSAGRPVPDERYLGRAWLLLVALYCRLAGLPPDTASWYWAEEGGVRRRALALFVEGMNERRQAGVPLLETWQWLFEHYVISQHTIASLDKWRQRQANTFHFRYEDGWFAYVRDGRADLSASRFDQAYTMLRDLGLFRSDPDTGDIHLTDLGHETLRRICASYHE